MTTPIQTKDLNCGSITLGQLLADLDFSDGPIRIDVPMCYSVDVRSAEEALEHIASFYDGAPLARDYCDHEQGSSQGVLYPGWDDQIAGLNDGSEEWPDDADEPDKEESS